eukprot:14675414-Alexandrium_andersonii.AAC.1
MSNPVWPRGPRAGAPPPRRLPLFHWPGNRHARHGALARVGLPPHRSSVSALSRRWAAGVARARTDRRGP